MSKKELILDTISDTALELVQCDRNIIENILNTGELTVDEMVKTFERALKSALGVR